MLRSVLAKAKPLTALRSGMKLRWMSAAASGGAPSAEEKKKLIDEFPYKWPWGQKVKVQSNKRMIEVTVPQTHPGARQHKLAYTIDAVPPSVPIAATQFIGAIGKATHLLFNDSLKAGADLDAVKTALSSFASTYEGNKKLQITLMNPMTQTDDKAKLVQEVATKAGCPAFVAKHLVQLQNDKLLAKTNEVARNFGVLVSERRKEKFGSIVSAEALTESQYNAISAKMQKLVQSDEKLIISREIDPTLIGGFMIRVGNRAQDLSVVSQIARMETHLKTFFSRNQAAADKVLAA